MSNTVYTRTDTVKAYCKWNIWRLARTELGCGDKSDNPFNFSPGLPSLAATLSLKRRGVRRIQKTEGFTIFSEKSPLLDQAL
jgi:hypothetical protein